MRDTDTARFYVLLDELDQQLGGPRRLRCCTANSGWPLNGVYYFFEESENRAAGQGPRVVRVGTQAVKTTTPSRRTLWDRLEKHRGRQPGDIGGPRRSHSVFRRHVGTAIIRRDDLGEEVLDNWYNHRHQPLEEQIEMAVSRYIGVMPRWLGQHAFKTEIRDSGLWNVQHTKERYDPGFLDLMAARVHALR